MLTVLVTGSNGLLGSRLCQILLDEGLNVIGTYKTKKDKIKYLEKSSNFRVIKTDLQDETVFFQKLKNEDISCIFHTAAKINIEESEKENEDYIFFKNNVMSTKNLLSFSLKKGIKNIIHSSSMSVYERNPSNLPINEDYPVNPSTNYGLSKLLAEKICDYYSIRYNLKVIKLRYCGIYGHDRKSGLIYNLIKNANSGEDLYVHEDKIKDILSVNEIANLNLNVFNQISSLVSSTFNIGSGQIYKISDIAETIKKLLNSNSNIVINKDNKTKNNFYFDIDKAKTYLGYDPLNYKESLSKEYNLI